VDNILAALLGYLIGSIPFGLLLTKAAGLGDVRQQGSGNIGAKGFVPVALAGAIWGEVAMAFAAGAAVIGHCYPVWLGFKGGKGVATNAGVSFGLAWPIGLVYAAVWLGVLAAFRISSLAGLCAVVAAAAAAPLFGYPQFFPVLDAIAVLVIYLHRANIARLLKGEEPKVGGKT
jgi:glycerol-3-phosphate acyltransferase PlsY